MSVGRQATPRSGSRSTRILGVVDDVGLLLLVVLLFPLIILLAGAPIALLVRLLVAAARLF